MDSCDIRVTAYKDGRTFQDCRDAASALVPGLAERVDGQGRVSWDEIMEASGYDAVVYKLAMKYLRQRGYHIGNHKSQWVVPGIISPDGA